MSKQLQPTITETMNTSEPTLTPTKFPPHLQKYAEEFATHGALSGTSYKELAELHGLPRPVVDTYIQGVLVRRQAELNAIYDSVGGEEAYRQLQRWAAENLTEGEIDDFNASLTRGVSQAALAVERLHLRYRDTVAA